MPQKPSLITDEDIAYACQVLDSFAATFDKVASKPSLATQLVIELAQNSNILLESLLAVTREDCRPVIYDLGKSVMRLVQACLKPKKP